jgi:hypothetical protein
MGHADEDQLVTVLCVSLSGSRSRRRTLRGVSAPRSYGRLKAQDAKAWKFTFREDEDKLPVDEKGKPRSATHRTYDNVMLEGANYRKLILIDGKPPDSKLQQKIEADMEKERGAQGAHSNWAPRSESGRPRLDRQDVR